MASVAFSLTVGLATDPTLALTEYYDEPAERYDLSKNVYAFVKTEIAARIVAVALSVFAACDALIQLGSCLYKGCYLLLSKKITLPTTSWNLAELEAHVRNSALFLSLVVVGTVAAVVFPNVCRHFPHNAPGEKEEYDAENRPETKEGEVETENMRVAREDVGHHVQHINEGKEVAPFDELQMFWEASPPPYKHWFVKIFGLDWPPFTSIRKAFQESVYRPIDTRPEMQRKARWLSIWEIEDEACSMFSRANAYVQAFYFHSTTRGELDTIFRLEEVNARRKKPWAGAYVSTHAEPRFGSCILAFNRNIERLSPVKFGFTLDNKSYWAGFDQAIPVRRDTLAFVILNSRSEYARRDVEKDLSLLAKRMIKVVLYDQVKDMLWGIEKVNLGIPKEWPNRDPFLGKEILKQLKWEAKRLENDLEYYTVIESIQLAATNVFHTVVDGIHAILNGSSPEPFDFNAR